MQWFNYYMYSIAMFPDSHRRSNSTVYEDFLVERLWLSFRPSAMFEGALMNTHGTSKR